MSDFPEKTCSIDRLVTHEKLVESALSGKKTQQRRAGIYGYPGESFELKGVKFVIKDLRQESLGGMTEAEAHSEGYPNLDMYRNLILRMHPGMEWNEEFPVWVHEFAQVDEPEND
jgi:hypothetical protein